MDNFSKPNVDILSQSYNDGVGRLSGVNKNNFRIPKELIEKRERIWNSLFAKYSTNVTEGAELYVKSMNPVVNNDGNAYSQEQRIPVRKSLDYIQYWVDTGKILCPRNPVVNSVSSESGSSISEMEIAVSNQSLDVFSKASTVRRNDSSKEASTVHGNDSSKENNIFHTVQKSFQSSSSSVDTGVYIRQNANTTKKAKAQALIEGSKIFSSMSLDKKLCENITDTANNTNKNNKSYKFETQGENNVHENQNQACKTNLCKTQDQDNLSSKHILKSSSDTSGELLRNNKSKLSEMTQTSKLSFRRKLYIGTDSPVDLNDTKTQLCQKSRFSRILRKEHPALDSSSVQSLNSGSTKSDNIFTEIKNINNISKSNDSKIKKTEIIHSSKKNQVDKNANKEQEVLAFSNGLNVKDEQVIRKETAHLENADTIRAYHLNPVVILDKLLMKSTCARNVETSGKQLHKISDKDYDCKHRKLNNYLTSAHKQTVTHQYVEDDDAQTNFSDVSTIIFCGGKYDKLGMNEINVRNENSILENSFGSQLTLQMTPKSSKISKSYNISAKGLEQKVETNNLEDNVIARSESFLNKISDLCHNNSKKHKLFQILNSSAEDSFVNMDVSQTTIQEFDALEIDNNEDVTNDQSFHNIVDINNDVGIFSQITEENSKDTCSNMFLPVSSSDESEIFRTSAKREEQNSRKCGRKRKIVKCGTDNRSSTSYANKLHISESSSSLIKSNSEKVQTKKQILKNKLQDEEEKSHRSSTLSKQKTGNQCTIHYSDEQPEVGTDIFVNNIPEKVRKLTKSSSDSSLLSINSNSKLREISSQDSSKLTREYSSSNISNLETVQPDVEEQILQNRSSESITQVNQKVGFVQNQRSCSFSSEENYIISNEKKALKEDVRRTSRKTNELAKNIQTESQRRLCRKISKLGLSADIMTDSCAVSTKKKQDIEMNSQNKSLKSRKSFQNMEKPKKTRSIISTRQKKLYKLHLLLSSDDESLESEMEVENETELHESTESILEEKEHRTKKGSSLFINICSDSSDSESMSLVGSSKCKIDCDQTLMITKSMNCIDASFKAAYTFETKIYRDVDSDES